MLYLCAVNSSVCQLLKQPQCFQSIGPLVQLPFNNIKLLSKALIARLIPADAVDDDMAVLIVIEDEVDDLISMLESTPSYKTIPVISVMIDLCRSPHNMSAFASRVNVVSKLSDMMDSVSEDDQPKVAELIWRMMEFNYTGNEKVSAVINNGTLNGL